MNRIIKLLDDPGMLFCGENVLIVNGISYSEIYDMLYEDIILKAFVGKVVQITGANNSFGLMDYYFQDGSRTYKIKSWNFIEYDN